MGLVWAEHEFARAVALNPGYAEAYHWHGTLHGMLGRHTEAQVVRKSEANNRNVEPGMIFMLDLGGGKGHAGLVIGVEGDHIITIEGNTNPGGSSDGFGVFRRASRPITIGVLLGYLDFCDI